MSCISDTFRVRREPFRPRQFSMLPPHWGTSLRSVGGLIAFRPAGGTVKYAPVLCRLWAFDAGAGIEPTSKLLGLHHTFVLLCCGLLTARRASDFSSIGKSAFRHTKLLVAGHGVEPHSKGIDPLPLPNPAVLFPAIVLPPGGQYI